MIKVEIIKSFIDEFIWKLFEERNGIATIESHRYKGIPYENLLIHDDIDSSVLLYFLQSDLHNQDDCYSTTEVKPLGSTDILLTRGWTRIVYFNDLHIQEV